MDNKKLSKQQVFTLYKFIEIFLEWNKKINLCGEKNKKKFIKTHITDSLSITKFIDFKNIEYAMDLGTGGGLPGIPLSIIYPNTKFLLIDSVEKKINVINEIASVLKFSNVFTCCSRAEKLGQNNKFRERFGLVVSRAVAPLPILLEYALPFLRKDGIFAAYKSIKQENEIETSKNALKTLGGKIERKEIYEIEDGKRMFFIFRKIKRTPKKYPRKPGMPKKKPL